MKQSSMTQATTTTPINMKENTMENTTADIDQIDDADITMPEKSPTDSTDQSASARSKKSKKVAKQPKASGPKVRILKVSRCASLSGRSELTYHVGCIDDAIQLRVYQNTGQGYFNQEWIPYDAIQELLTSHELFTAETLRSIFLGKSVNTAGFFMAVLKHLGLIETSKANRRCYSHTDSATFEDQTEQLIASGVSVEVAEPATPASTASKKGTLKLKPKQA